MRSRQDATAAEFDDRLMEGLADVPRGVVADRTDADRLADGIEKLRHAWRRTTVIDSREIEDRISALDMALFIGLHDVRALPEGDEINLYPIEVAIRDLRKALGPFQRHQPMPDAEFPSARKLVALAHPDGRNIGLDGVREWLIEQGVT